MKKALKAILITLFVIAVLTIFGLLFYHSDLYTKLEKSRIEKQLGRIYGTDFEVDSIDERESLFPKFGAKQGFIAYSRDGVFELGECDWKGTVLTDSYCHYFYAPALNQELQNIIYSCLTDYYIVRDCFEFGGNKAAVDLIAVNETVNVDAYTAKIDRKETFFRVYVKDNVTVEQLQKALDQLKEKQFMGNVYFMRVSEELFIQLQHSCMDCYYKFSGIDAALAKYLTCIDGMEREQLVTDPFKYVVAQHAPKWGKSEITDLMSDPQSNP